ncbi:hypothetical protein KIMH_05120 [Bombiscardovia apis]|uniref:Uncharacterized protein n=1 Tax=Bombiscardovia apis TaxID=2932182 RepID=A0ABN6SEF7_9BIFI|nr:hypothetical protein KIMH_05120 [Bombiscardovia apis]
MNQRGGGTMRTQHITVLGHDEGWHGCFEGIRERIVAGMEEAGMGGALVGVEHVGSTAVCGL